MSDTTLADCLVSTEWLAARLGEPDLRILDATYYLPSEQRDARKEYEAEHIPGAIFFDIDDVKDPANPLPHMLPAPEVFSSKLRRLGIGDGHRVVVYDRRRMMSGPRVWWSLRAYGHREVAVLDGGLAKWKAEGRPLDDRPVASAERHFTARLDRTALAEQQQVRKALEKGRSQVLDARSRERFEGRAPELWPGRRSGHMPGSRNLPWQDLVDPEHGTLLPPEALRRRFAEAGIDPGRPVIASCGSGVTAAVLLLGLARIGARDLALYDGSWAEWGLPDGPPIETGPPAETALRQGGS